MKIKWDPNENQEDMDIDQKWRLQQKDLIISGVYDWWRCSQLYLDLLDSTTIGKFAYKEIYAKFKQFVNKDPPTETHKNSRESTSLREDNIDQIWTEVEIDLKAKIVYFILFKQF